MCYYFQIQLFATVDIFEWEFCAGAHLLTSAYNVFRSDSSDPIEETSKMLSSGAFCALLYCLGNRSISRHNPITLYDAYSQVVASSCGVLDSFHFQS